MGRPRTTLVKQQSRPKAVPMQICSAYLCSLSVQTFMELKRFTQFRQLWSGNYQEASWLAQGLKYLMIIINTSVIIVLLRCKCSFLLKWIRYHYSKLTGPERLGDACKNFIVSNFNVVLDALDWVEMEREELADFMAMSELCVESERILWEKVRIFSVVYLLAECQNENTVILCWTCSTV